MHVQAYEATGLYDFFNSLYGGTKEQFVTEADKIFNELLEDAEAMDKLIELRRNMTDEDFIRLLEKVAAFEIDIYDMIRVYSKLNNIEYFWWRSLRTTTKYDLTIIATEDIDVDHGHYYSLSEIKELVDSKKIVIISEEKIENMNYKDKMYRNEAIDTFNPVINDECGPVIFSLDNYFVKRQGEYYTSLIKDIRRNAARNERLKEELRVSIDEISLGVHCVRNFIKRRSQIDKQDWNYREKKEELEMYKACLENFEQKGYIKRLVKLDKKYSNTKRVYHYGEYHK